MTMSGEDYRQSIKRLDLTPVDAARFLGVDDTTSRRWAADKSPIPLAVEMLLYVMLRYNLTARSVETLLRRKRDAA